MQIVLGIGRSNNGCARLQVVSDNTSAAVVRQGKFLTLTFGKDLHRESKKFSTQTHECGTVREAKAYMANLAQSINMGMEAKDVALPF